MTYLVHDLKNGAFELIDKATHYINLTTDYMYVQVVG